MLEGIYIFVGLMFVASISVVVIAVGMFKAAEFYTTRNDERFKEYILGQLHSYDRWLCHDFPQISEMLNQLEVEIKNGWRTGGQDTFREHLRKKYKP